MDYLITFFTNLQQLEQNFYLLLDTMSSFVNALNKAMRLPKNFAISQKSKVKSQWFLTVKNCPKLSHLYFAFDFRESVTKTTKSFENFDISQKCWKYTGIVNKDGICQK